MIRKCITTYPQRAVRYYIYSLYDPCIYCDSMEQISGVLNSTGVIKYLGWGSERPIITFPSIQ